MWLGYEAGVDLPTNFDSLIAFAGQRRYIARNAGLEEGEVVFGLDVCVEHAECSRGTGVVVALGGVGVPVLVTIVGGYIPLRYIVGRRSGLRW